MAHKVGDHVYLCFLAWMF